MEVTKWLKPSISVSRIGDSASVQAATWVNAEQASKRTMCRPTRLPYRGRLKWLGEMSEEYAQLLHRGIGGKVEELLFRGHPEVVDADLADYFGSIPHAELLQSVARRDR